MGTHAHETPTAKLVYNVGAGQGYSVRELAAACQRATGVAFRVDEHPRRQGYPPYVVGDARLIFAELGWRASHTNLTESIEHAWRWRLKLRAEEATANMGTNEHNGKRHGGSKRKESRG